MMSQISRHAAAGCPGRSTARSRRAFLRNSAIGFGQIAFAALGAVSSPEQWLRLKADEGATAATDDIGEPAPWSDPRTARLHPTRARRVIFCFMEGGVSQVDTFDPKPKLDELDGKAVVIRRQESPNGAGQRKWLRSPWPFRQHGQSGIAVSDLFPYLAQQVDELAVIRSFTGLSPLHPQGGLFLHQGRSFGGLPSMGSWISYGLGSENENLPGYVVLSNDWLSNTGLQAFSNGFLPARHQPTVFRADKQAVDNVVPAEGSLDRQQSLLNLVMRRNAEFARQRGNDDALEAVVRNFEVAARMQLAVPDTLDLDREPNYIHELYGTRRDDPKAAFYAVQCLRARRLIESGVRFVEITCPLTTNPTSPWDHHSGLKSGHEHLARITDQPLAALITDLKARGLFDDTLIVWAGEMGRTPHTANGDGRDHHTTAYSIWLAGGGIRGGTIYGASDELGMHVAESPCDPHDLHATMLYLLGLEHQRLTYRHSGRDYRLTDVHGNVLTPLVA